MRREPDFLKFLPRVPVAAVVWAIMGFGLVSLLAYAGARYDWPDTLVTGVRALIVLVVGLRVVHELKVALAESRVEVLAQLEREGGVFDITRSWKDSVTGAYLIHVLLYAGLALLVVFAVGGTLSGFLVSGTLLSVMLGVAGQSFFANFFGGLAIAIFKPFEIGDHVQLIAWQLPLMAETYAHETRAQGYRGYIRDINLFYSELRLDDGQMLRVPNGVVIHAGILKVQATSWRRSRFRFDVPLTAPLEATFQAVTHAAARHFDGSPIGDDGVSTPQGSPLGVHHPLAWHAPEARLVDIGRESVAIELEVSALERDLATVKSDFYRELAAWIEAHRGS